MSTKGNCYDNAVKDPFYGGCNSFSVRNLIFSDAAELHANVFGSIEIHCNRFRKHSSLSYKSHVQMEEKSSSSRGTNCSAPTKFKM